MSTLEVLKEYLVGDDGYLLNTDNNGKTVMLSGAWGSGKTHFWQNEIVREQKNKYTEDEYKEGLSYKLNKKNKACVYVSLYGKPSMESIELDLYMNAYKNIEGDADFVSTICSVFTSLGKNLGNMAHKGAGSTFAWLENLVDKDKLKKAGEYIGDGGLICFDDFERKSKDIDLNDLFGFISQLTLEYNCRVVIILNSDVFEGEEANVFKTVKEKTVNKFFYFEPTIDELFESIYSSDSKYKRLDTHKAEILNAIKETEELNARIYIQVLDNCLEWIDKEYSMDVVKVLVLTTMNFNLNHILLEYVELEPVSSFYHMGSDNTYMYNILEKYHDVIQRMSILQLESSTFSESTFWDIKKRIYTEVKRKGKNQNEIYSEQIQKVILDELIENEKELKAIWKYGYQLSYFENIEEAEYIIIYNFVKSGILLKKEDTK